MIIEGLNLTDTRATFLGKVDSSSDWIRDCGITVNTRTDQRMPQPAYMWLVENHLIDCDCGNLFATQKGRRILAEFHRRTFT